MCSTTFGFVQLFSAQALLVLNGSYFLRVSYKISERGYSTELKC